MSDGVGVAVRQPQPPLVDQAVLVDRGDGRACGNRTRRGVDRGDLSLPLTATRTTLSSAFFAIRAGLLATGIVVSSESLLVSITAIWRPPRSDTYNS